MSRQADIFHHHSDAFDRDDQPEPGWTAGDIQFDDEPPSRELESDPGQRKWMLLGAGICGLITAAVVLFVSADDPQDNTAAQLELSPTAVASEPATQPAVVSQPELPELGTTSMVQDHTLASLAAAVEAPDLRTFRAPPPPPLIEQPAVTPKSEPTPPPPSAKLVKPTPVTKPAPTPKPVVVVEPVVAPPSPVAKPSLGPLPSIEDDAELPPPPPVFDVERSDPGGLIDVTSDETAD